MSESYTIGGDSLVKATAGVRLGQTFRVLEEHILEWIDLNIKPGAFYPTPTLLVFLAGDNHEPKGEYLSRNRWIEYSSRIAFITQRVRFPMQPITLYPHLYYCITLQRSGDFPPNEPEWLYDAGDATYPRGNRILSTDFGLTWQKFFFDDHIFVEFGTPPAPEPPPEPPIDKFIPTKLIQTQTPDGVNIKLGTNVPCHLTLYWTKIKPKKHPLTRLARGLDVPWYTRYCFVSYHEVEQLEPGDTLYHTFILTQWQICEARWFTIRGNINEKLSPSVGPVFFKHKRTAFQELLYTEPWTYLSPPPPAMVIIFEEPWTTHIVFDILLYTEPWTHLSPPPPAMVSLFTEPWTHLSPPPPAMVSLFTEPWNYLSPPPPSMDIIFTESWTEPIVFDNLLFTEPWTYLAPPPPSMLQLVIEPWTDL